MATLSRSHRDPEPTHPATKTHDRSVAVPRTVLAGAHLTRVSLGTAKSGCHESKGVGTGIQGAPNSRVTR